MSSGIDNIDVTTRSGRQLSYSRMGFGGVPLGNMYDHLSDAQAAALVDRAWRSGMRYFDTAPYYGKGLSERRLGAALRAHPRGEFVLSTKVGKLIEPNPEAASNAAADSLRIRFDYSYDGILRSYEESLRRLDLQRVDILFVHDVDSFTHGSAQAAEQRIRELIDGGGWRALDELRASGEVQAIGAGVNNWEPCARLLELCDPDVFLLAGRYTLLEQAPLHNLLPACVQRGVHIAIGGPFNSGVLARRGGDFDYGPAPQAVVERAEALRSVCESFDVHLADAALQFVLAHPAVATVIPGAQSPAELQANVTSLTKRLPAALWEMLKSRGLLDAQAPVPSGAA